jgi:hypothetical protein
MRSSSSIENPFFFLRPVRRPADYPGKKKGRR